jgi:hypothetical protein
MIQKATNFFKYLKNSFWPVLKAKRRAEQRPILPIFLPNARKRGLIQAFVVRFAGFPSKKRSYMSENDAYKRVQKNVE